MMKSRIEKDSMGEMEIPPGAWWGASTQRAVQNFPISGVHIPPEMIAVYSRLKGFAAEANLALGLLDENRARRISAAAEEISDGKHDGQFPVDLYQTGSGTSTNMNVNEVIAGLCNRDDSAPHVHPNDHVNLGQSSNDTFPTVIHIATAIAIRDGLEFPLYRLAAELERKAEEFSDVLKIGRTHLMDATPVRLGQEFGGWAAQARNAVKRCEAARAALMPLALGGTAVGTGLNTHPEFTRRVIGALAKHYNLPLTEAGNHFEAQSARDACVEAHGQLQTVAVSLHKIASDIRLLASGPNAGLAEISLPAVQPGSSIMPGKVNPVMAEVLTMAAARVMGNQTTVAWCGAGGFLELNVSMPLIGSCLLESARLLAAATGAFTEKAVAGISAREENCRAGIEKSLAMVTALVPLIGYDRAAELAKQSAATGKTIRALCHENAERLGISAAEIDAALDPEAMV